MPTESRPNADDSARTGPYADITSNPHEIHPMPRLPTACPLIRHVGQTSYSHPERLTGTIASDLASASDECAADAVGE